MAFNQGAGGYMAFGPTFNSTPFVRLGYEGLLGSKPIGATLVSQAQQNSHEQLLDTANENGLGTTGYPIMDFPLAGKIAALDTNGNLVLAGTTQDAAGNTITSTPIGLFREDLGDMVNASNMGTYYFGFGEYYIAESRVSSTYVGGTPAIGDQLTFNSNGELTKVGASDAYTATNPIVVGFVTYVGEYTAGNMYANAGEAANGGTFIGFQLKL